MSAMIVVATLIHSITKKKNRISTQNFFVDILRMIYHWFFKCYKYIRNDLFNNYEGINSLTVKCKYIG